MLKKLFLISVVGLALGVGTAHADVYVRVGPPVAVVEHRPVSPGRHYVWVAGYHQWDGRAYAWTPGYWAAPPRPHARWVPHRWVHRKGGWVLVQGYWR